MADDTLLRGDFETSRIVKTNMNGQERYALAQMLVAEEPGTPRAAFVRSVLLIGMAALGWDEARQIEEYAKYRLRCIQTGVGNLFESE